MRKLKFRIWSYEDKEYRTDCNLTQIFNSMTGTPATVYSDEGDRFDIEQYTGLKDMDGTEIYEGDILMDGYGELVEYWVVKFEDGKFIGEIQGVTEDLFELTDLDIIGNIHENPELLGGEE